MPTCVPTTPHDISLTISAQGVADGTPATPMPFLDLPRADARELGAYYTPPSAARLMADWLLRNEPVDVLEPSMGDGVFVAAVNEARRSRGLTDVRVIGVEYARMPFESVVDRGLISRDNAIHSDFTAVDPFPVDAVIGNPPYVRLRHLPPKEARRAREVAQRVLGTAMDPSGSVWMPFVLHSLQFLRRGGRLALVLPYDFTYVRYARPLWRLLGRKFGSLRLLRVRERIFEDLLQDVVLLFADDFGGSTAEVLFEAFATKAEMLDGHNPQRAPISIAKIESGERPFKEGLLSLELRELLAETLHERTVELGDVARFNIGYVTGHKQFFHPAAEAVRGYQLSANDLQPTVTSARQVRGAGLYTSGIPPARRNWLFLPPRGPLTREQAAYVEKGENGGVSTRYKCRVRTPWWIVPYVSRPDLLVSVFSEHPSMLINDADMFASNSLLCGYVNRGVDARCLVAGWYTSLASLHRELQVHSLGGGVFVLVPNEIARVRVPLVASAALSLKRLDDAVRALDMTAAYQWGRSSVLSNALGLTDRQIDLVEDGRDTLRRWRKSASGH